MTQVDRLAAIRSEIRTLRNEARVIRQKLVSGAESLIGSHYVAQVQQRITLRPVAAAVRPGNGVSDLTFLRSLEKEAHSEF
jgi:hypothetical protein